MGSRCHAPRNRTSLTPAAAALTSQGIIEECLQDIVLNATAAEEAAQKANDKLNAAIAILME